MSVLIDGAQEELAILWSAVDEVAADDQVERLGLHAERRRLLPRPHATTAARVHIRLPSCAMCGLFL